MVKLKIFYITLVLSLFGYTAYAQPAGAGPGQPPVGGPPPCWPPPCIPIDGGIGFLIIAGLGLGAKKILNYRKYINSQSHK